VPLIRHGGLATASADEDVYGIIERMRVNGIRRLPVVDSLGALSGMVSIDDLLAFLAQETAELARISSGQLVHEKRLRK
jgi:Mg/Co/Ni transporter MgtE